MNLKHLKKYSDFLFSSRKSLTIYLGEMGVYGLSQALEASRLNNEARRLMPAFSPVIIRSYIRKKLISPCFWEVYVVFDKRNTKKAKKDDVAQFVYPKSWDDTHRDKLPECPSYETLTAPGAPFKLVKEDKTIQWGDVLVFIDKSTVWAMGYVGEKAWDKSVYRHASLFK